MSLLSSVLKSLHQEFVLLIFRTTHLKLACLGWSANLVVHQREWGLLLLILEALMVNYIFKMLQGRYFTRQHLERLSSTCMEIVRVMI